MPDIQAHYIHTVHKLNITNLTTVLKIPPNYIHTLYLLLNVKLKLSPYNMMHLETLLNSNALQWLHF